MTYEEAYARVREIAAPGEHIVLERDKDGRLTGVTYSSTYDAGDRHYIAFQVTTIRLGVYVHVTFPDQRIFGTQQLEIVSGVLRRVSEAARVLEEAQ